MMRPLLVVTLVAFVSVAGGCAFSRGFAGPGWVDGKIVTDQQNLVVAMTNAKLHRGKRQLFDDRTRALIKKMDEYPGYVGGTFRFQVLGDEVWTMTIWNDRASLQKFVDDRRHVEAMYVGSSGVRLMRTLVQDVPVKELPWSWDRAQAEIAKLEWKELKNGL